ncbi:MAG: nucleoside phosphorylase [Tannerella sp.]|jgi:uridine phosphorylase|nr:nucleoside phosphorylase [Tannerella sp.]
MNCIENSELIINDDGSIFHLHLKPEQLADRIVLCGDPARVSMIAGYFETRECDISNREFHTVTGTYNGKRITVVSHGIGCDNMDIVINELDVLANIDFETRTVRPKFRQLTMVRIGTSGGLQPFIPVGSYVAAEKSIGFDGVVYFYRGSERIRDIVLENELIRHLDWKITGIRPYAVSADTSLTEQIAKDDIVRGITVAANGFYGPQGRRLRLPLTDTELNRKIGTFYFENKHITNFEMESSALAGLSAMMGHRAVTVCCIIAGRVNKSMKTDCNDILPTLIEKVLERI